MQYKLRVDIGVKSELVVEGATSQEGAVILVVKGVQCLPLRNKTSSRPGSLCGTHREPPEFSRTLGNF